MAKADVDEFDSILATVQKKYQTGVGAISKIALPSYFVTTGNIGIDYICGGGFPLGRSLELAGPYSSGKTTIATQTAAVIQKIILAGGGDIIGTDGSVFRIKGNDKILYMDYESTIDQEYCKKLGLDIDDDSFLLSQPGTLEDGANIAIALIETGRIRMVIWDSVPLMLPSAKAMNEIGKSLPAVHAKLMTDLGARLTPLLYEHQTLNIYVNHLKEQLDMSGRRPAHLGPKMGTPGGAALKFYETMRLEFQQVGQVKEKDIDPLTGKEQNTPTGTDVRVKVTKNKVGRPFRQTEVRVRFGRGFDNFWTAMMILQTTKHVMYSTGYYYFHKLEEEGLAPEWMKRATTGQKRPYIKTNQALLLEADLHPEWRDAVIAYAQEVVKNFDEELEISAESLEEIEERIADEEATEKLVAEMFPASEDPNRVQI